MTGMHEILTWSGRRIGAAIAAGELTSEEATQAHIHHAQQVNPTLNAIVNPAYESALEAARAFDQRRRKAKAPAASPYAGVPCTLKESFAWQGKPNTAGLVSRKALRAEKNATAVQRLLDQDLIPLGQTNTSELCMWMESYNNVYGRTHNPYNPKHIVGGSSGGEGAIVGSGASPLGLGSDVGGSIRMPAFFNGVFGHKPSGGLVPNSGQFPMAAGREGNRYCTTGPIVRRAEDLWPLLQVMAGPDGIDPGCEAISLGNPASVSIKGLRVISIPDNDFTPVTDDLRAAQKRVAEALEAAGAKVETRHFPALRRSVEIWASMLGETEPVSSFRTQMGKTVAQLWLELLKMPFGKAEHTLPAVALGLIENIGHLAPRRAEAAIAAGKALRAEIAEAVGANGVFLYPSYSEPAPVHTRPLRTIIHWAYTSILNVMEFPVTQVPLGLNAQGLPLGVQVGSAYGQDHITVAVAHFLEREFGGWVAPWSVK